MRKINRIAGIEGVSSGATVTVKLPVNRRYHGLKFFVTNNGSAVAASTVIDRVRLFVNGKSQRDITAARAIIIATLNGVAPATGELPIQFSEPWRADKIDEQILAWDLFGESSFEVQLQLKGSLTNPTVSGIAIFDAGQTLIDGRVTKNIMRQHELGKNAVSGLNDFDNLSRDLPIHRILLDAASTINSVEVTADDNKVYEVLKAENARLLADYGLVSTAVEFPICFDFTEQVLGDALVVSKSLNVRFDSSAAQAVTALVESRANGFN
jgi:hypothetical protein